MYVWGSTAPSWHFKMTTRLETPLLGRTDAAAQAIVINALQRSAATNSAWMTTGL